MSGPPTPVLGTHWPPSEVLISHSREGADCVSLIGSSVLSRAVSDGIFSKRTVSQAGLQKAFAFSANRYYSKQRDLGYGASLCSCAFVIVTCFQGQGPLPVQEKGRVLLPSTWQFCPRDTFGNVCSHFGLSCLEGRWCWHLVVRVQRYHTYPWMDKTAPSLKNCPRCRIQSAVVEKHQLRCFSA